jgi:hypothetical protein
VQLEGQVREDLQDLGDFPAVAGRDHDFAGHHITVDG